MFSHRQSYFNSNMVRLKAFLLFAFMSANSNFNSNMVRLKVNDPVVLARQPT